MVIFWARCCIILFFKKKIRVALESRTLIWVPLLQAMTLNMFNSKCCFKAERKSYTLLGLGRTSIGEKLYALVKIMAEANRQKVVRIRLKRLFAGQTPNRTSKPNPETLTFVLQPPSPTNPDGFLSFFLFYFILFYFILFLYILHSKNISCFFCQIYIK